MPIRPENRARYPSNWKEIRASILARAENRCEFCGLENYAWVIRGAGGFALDLPDEFHQGVVAWLKEVDPKWRRVRIVLTIAHLDHTPENCAPENLRALCQSCHLSYDAKHHARTRRTDRRQLELSA